MGKLFWDTTVLVTNFGNYVLCLEKLFQLLKVCFHPCQLSLLDSKQPSEFYKRYGGREVPPLWTCATADDGIS